MDTKECIELIKDKIKMLCHWESTELNKVELDEIIKHLQCNEKFEEFLEELKQNIKGKTSTYLNLVIMDLIEKYFPKLVKKTITIEFEADNEDTIKSNINLLKAHLERVEDIPPKIKYMIKESD